MLTDFVYFCCLQIVIRYFCPVFATYTFLYVTLRQTYPRFIYDRCSQHINEIDMICRDLLKYIYKSCSKPFDH